MSVTDKRYALPATGRKGLKMRLRRWQDKAKNVVVEMFRSGRDRAMIAACPGAGKTAFTISLAKHAVFADASDVTVIVVPSRALKRQWRKAFKAQGIGAKDDIGNDVLERRAAYVDELMFDPERPVQVYTYSQIASNPEIFRILCARHKVFAVFDEVHHADDDAAFGASLAQAFEGAVFKLSLSGTPFNTKGGRLAFCDLEKTTDDQGRDLNKTVVDFEYSYGEALRATGTDEDPFVVRAAQFVRWNGIARWRSISADGVETDHVVTGARKSDPLSPMVEMDGDYPKKMIDAALAKLTEVRESQSNAGMLITAMSRDHCEEVVAHLQRRGVRDVTAIMHDTPNAADEIERWAKSNERVLVAIKMISEGVDIKRLRVGVYLSNVLTQMFFIQFIGRFIRWDGSLDAGQFACVFIPEHVTLIRYALEIESMVTEAEDAITESDPSRAPANQSRVLRYGLSSDGSFNGLIDSGETMSKPRAEVLADVLASLNLRGKVTEAVAEKIIDAWGKRNPSYQPDAEPSKPETSLSKKNDQLVTAVAGESQKRGGNWSFKDVNSYANAAVGIQRKDALTPDSVLEQRLDVLKELLIRVRRGEGPYEAAA
jgi:superfamily II DNA or RNA helicase